MAHVPKTSSGDLLTVEQAATRLGRSSRTVFRMIAGGELRAVTVLGRVRVPVEDLDRLLEPRAKVAG